MSLLQVAKATLVDSMDEANNLMSWLGTVKGGSLSFDTETTGTDMTTDTPRLIQVGYGDHGWAIPVDEWLGLAREVFRRWDQRLTAHNAPFDVCMLDKVNIGVDVSKVDDTLIMAHVLDSTERVALKPQSAKYVDPYAAAAQGRLSRYMTEHGFTWADVPIVSTGPGAIYWKYGALDTVLTHHLREHHMPLVQSRSPVAYEIEMRALWVVENMRRRGMKVDRDYTRKLQDQLTVYIDDVEEWVKRRYGISPGSNQAVAEILVGEGYGDYLTERTETGAYSLTAKVLEPLMGHQLVSRVMYRRQAQKINSTFLRAFLKYSEHDGLIHPSINTVGTSESKGDEAFGVKTARMSMSNPNLQQISKPSAKNPFSTNVRNCLTARDDDHVLVMFDLDQIEMRLMAHFSQDPTLVNAFHTEGDFFVQLMHKLYDDTTITKSDPRRNNVKTLSYGTLYGMGADKFAASTGQPVDEARSMFDLFHRTIPGAKDLTAELSRMADIREKREGRGYVTSELSGRRIYAEKGRGYAILNHYIQGAAAEVLKMMLAEGHKAGVSDYWVIPVHDEVGGDVPKDRLKDYVETMREVMTMTDRFTVPITSGGAAGFRWGEKVDI